MTSLRAGYLRAHQRAFAVAMMIVGVLAMVTARN
jgi:hypothetical protein